MSARHSAARAFVERFGEEPEGISFASGRINLIGEHVDYNDGLVLPMPVEQGTAVAWRRMRGEIIEIFAQDLQATDRFCLTDPALTDEIDWRSYCRGMVALAPVRPACGLRMAVSGDLTRGAGLSSSASLCIAIGRALSEAEREVPDPTALARAAQRTEHRFANVACGIMDQMAIAAAKPGEAMFLDCRDLTFRSLGIPVDWAVLAVESGVKRGLVDGEYNLRREQCAEAARLLGVSSLRDVPPDISAHTSLPHPLNRRARHVISEISRVREAVEALSKGDLLVFCRLLSESHASLRDLFEVSVPAVDSLVDRLKETLGHEGGARMTGAGFGGAVVVVARQSPAQRLLDELGETATPVYGLTRR